MFASFSKIKYEVGRLTDFGGIENNELKLGSPILIYKNVFKFSKLLPNLNLFPKIAFSEH